MLSRFPDPEAFLFGTTASLNIGSELQLRTVAVKTESSGVKLENAAPGAPDLVKLIKEELWLFNAPITTFSVFDQFLQATSYRKQIMADRDLQHLVAPTILQPSMEARTLLSRAQQFKSPEYQETVTLDEHTGLTLVSDQRIFVFPSEQRMTSVKAVTFHYVRGDRKPEVKVHQLLRPHFWRWLKVALTGTDFAHLLTLGWECDHTWVFGRLIKQQDNEREESDQLLAILAVQDELRTKSPKGIPTQVNSTEANPGDKLECCYKFLEGKCQDAACIHPHVKMNAPLGVCLLYLADKTSCSGCDRLHEQWESIIKMMNEGIFLKPTAPKPIMTTNLLSTQEATWLTLQRLGLLKSVVRKPVVVAAMAVPRNNHLLPISAAAHPTLSEAELASPQIRTIDSQNVLDEVILPGDQFNTNLLRKLDETNSPLEPVVAQEKRL
jgi:hypothetical protein